MVTSSPVVGPSAIRMPGLQARPSLLLLTPARARHVRSDIVA